MALETVDAPRRPSPVRAAGRALAGGAGVGALTGMVTAAVFLGGAAIEQNPPGQRLQPFLGLPVYMLIGIPFGVACGLIGALFSGLLVAGLAPWWRSPVWAARLAGAVLYAVPVLLASLIGTVLAPHMGALWPHPAIAVPAFLGAAAGGLWLGPWLLGVTPVRLVTRWGLIWSAAAAAVLLLVPAVTVGGLLGRAPGQRVEVVAGAGTVSGGLAADTPVHGRLLGMTASAGGVLRLLTAQGLDHTLWTVRDGRIGRVPVPGLDQVTVAQVVTGPDGGMYAALRQGPGSVVRIEPDGGTVRVLGPDRATYQGPAVPVPDGTPVDGAYLGVLEGVAVSADGRFHFAESRLGESTYQVVRTVRDGRLATVLGREMSGDWRSASVRGGFPDGVRSTGLTIDSGYVTPMTITTDGLLYAAVGARGVVRVGADGAVHQVIGALTGSTADLGRPETPWRERGAAAGVPVSLGGDAEGANLVADLNGDIYLTNRRWIDDRLPESFAWDGVTGSRRAVVEQARKDRWMRGETEVLRVTRDGRVASVAAQADLVAVQGDWLYLAQTFQGGDDTDRVLVVRTPIPR
ncbi:hypothetical protein [Actinoplanes sp. NPDC026670]|uniref:hypothetical protein n=1 Tax=Actinoplanes sp. NPDC026670 TaxID=3154700 RepID=UPI0034051E96